MSSLVSFSDAQKAAALVYQGSGFVPSGWEIDLSFNAGLPPATPGELALDNGFYAYAVKPTADNTAADPNARMLVFRGTETANPFSFVTDFLADVRDIGESQFSLAAGRINQWLAQELVDGHKVELIGHSLGGALVQWAINDQNMTLGPTSVQAIARTLPNSTTGQVNSSFTVDPNYLHFTTFNAPGISLAPGAQLAPTVPNPAVINTIVSGEHHVIALDLKFPIPGLYGDFVHAIGGRPVGGTLVGHQVDFELYGKVGNFLESHDITAAWWTDSVGGPPVVAGYAPPFPLNLQQAQFVGRFIADNLDAYDGINPIPQTDIAKLLIVLAVGLPVGLSFETGVQLGQRINSVSPDLDVLRSKLEMPGLTGLVESFKYLGDRALAVGQEVNAFAVGLVKDVAAATVIAGSTVLGFVLPAIDEFLTNTVNGFAKAVDGFLRQVDTTLNLGRTLTYSDLVSERQIYDQALRDPQIPGIIRESLEQAQAVLSQAGQTVVISTGVGVNPFDGQGFDPTAVPPATVSVNEGQWQALSIYLPFAADTGGQHLTLSLNGSVASSFVLRTTDGELTQQNGGFSLVVPESERYLMVELRAKDDVSSTSNLSLSVELTTPDGDPTHEEKVEASITLTDTGKLLNGDLPVTNYFNGQQTVTWVGDNDNNEPIFNAGANHVVFGNGGYDVLDLSLSVAMFNHQVFGGMGNDAVYGGEGQDRLYGDEGFDLLSGGGGRDVVYGGDTADRLMGDAADPTLVNSVPGDDYLDGGLGDDRLEGQAGNDTLWGGPWDVCQKILVDGDLVQV